MIIVKEDKNRKKVYEVKIDSSIDLTEQMIHRNELVY